MDEVKYFSLAHYEKYPVIQCPYCQMSFILIALLQSDDGLETTIKQEVSDFCPYCGERLKEE